MKLQRMDKSKARFAIKARSKRALNKLHKRKEEELSLYEKFPVSAIDDRNTHNPNHKSEEKSNEDEQSEDLIDRVLKSVLCDMNIEDFLNMKR